MSELIDKAKEEFSEIKDKASKALKWKEETQIPERFLIPATDIYETEKEIALVADMPGVKKENLKVLIKNDELLIEGKVEPWSKEEKLLYSEIYHYNYKRSFILSDTIDKNKICAKIDNGVLYITLPKEEKVLPREIPISIS